MSAPHVLVIDDDPYMLKLLELALRREGMDVLLASQGERGLQLFEEQAPDVIIVDIAMPGMDGYDVIRHIRASGEAGGQTPIIVLTAHEQNPMRVYASELGVDRYLRKPIQPAELVEHILALIRGGSE